MEYHKGQVSLPGGAQEPGETLETTALREVAEELGIAASCIEVLDGPLTPVYIPISGFRVTPFVGFAPIRPALTAAPDEVIEIIEAPLEAIVDDGSIHEEEWDIRGESRSVPFFAIHGHKVWGATAMMLSEFAEMLKQAGV